MTAKVIVFRREQAVEPPCEAIYALLAPTIIQTLRELVEHSEFCSVNEALAIRIEANRLSKAVLRRSHDA